MTNDRVVMHEARTMNNGKTWEPQRTVFSVDGGTTWKPVATGDTVSRKWYEHTIPSGRLASSPHPVNPPRSETDMKYPGFDNFIERYKKDPIILRGHTHDAKPVDFAAYNTHDAVTAFFKVDDFLREVGVDKRKRAKAMGEPDPYAAAAEALGCTREEAKNQMLRWSFGWTTSSAPGTLPDPHED